MQMVMPSLVGIKKIVVSATASSVSASGSKTIEVPVDVDGVILGLPILVSVTEKASARVLYGTDGGFMIEVTNEDSSNAQNIVTKWEVWIYPNV